MTKRRKLWATLLLLLFAATALFAPSLSASAENTTDFAGGDGTAANPYKISTAAHLNNVRNHLDACFVLINDVVFSAGDFAPGGTYYNNGDCWISVGWTSSGVEFFSGTLDGKGFSVRNVVLRRSGTPPAPYFGLIAGNIGTVKNLHVTGASYEINTQPSTVVGGVVGVNRGNLSGCSFAGTINITTSNLTRAGGIAGDGYYRNNAIIANCTNKGTIVASGATVYVGGVVGRLQYGVSGCVNTGTVTAKPIAQGYAGGIAGYCEDTSQVLTCRSSGEISSSASGDSGVGGIAGYCYAGTVGRCYNTGNITAISYEDSHSGGIVGFGSSTNVSNCYNNGAVSAIATSEDALGVYSGGICGDLKGSITNCYNTGSISATDPIEDPFFSVSYSNPITPVLKPENCYYLTGTGSDKDSTACTAEEMSQQSVFAGFDFASVWTMEGNASYLFPELQGLTVTGCGVHRWGTWTVKTAAGCETAGTRIRTCSACGTTDSETIPPLNHNFGNWVVTTAATCGGKGLQTRTCTNPGCYEKETEQLAALTHSWGTGTVTKAATCESDGIRTYTCSQPGCGKTKIETVAALKHNFSSPVVTKAATCTETGTETGTCANCKQTTSQSIPATGHNYGAWSITQEATCEAAGIEERKCGKCSAKQTEVLPALGHSFKSPTVTKKPTCTEAGEESGICTRCNETTTQPLAATGHSFGEWTVTKSATCTEEGVEERSCSDCAERETSVRSALGHYFEDSEIVQAPSCTEEGIESGICTLCKEATTQTVPALGHDFGEITVLREATETEEGLQEKTCSACGETERSPIPVLGSTSGKDPANTDLQSDKTAPATTDTNAPDTGNPNAWIYWALGAAWIVFILVAWIVLRN